MIPTVMTRSGQQVQPRQRLIGETGSEMGLISLFVMSVGIGL